MIKQDNKKLITFSLFSYTLYFFLVFQYIKLLKDALHYSALVSLTYNELYAGPTTGVDKVEPVPE